MGVEKSRRIRPTCQMFILPIYRPDYGGSTHLRNIGLLRDYTALHPRKLLNKQTNNQTNSALFKFNVLNLLVGSVLSNCCVSKIVNFFKDLLAVCI
jgi:hypothetical protein